MNSGFAFAFVSCRASLERASMPSGIAAALDVTGLS
jgi:hypothetical protein